LLGAHVGINYKENPNWHETVINSTPNKEGVDLILDFVGAPYFEKNITSLRIDGKMVMLGFLGGSQLSEKTNIAPILTKRITISGSTLRAR
jgi:NADPH:quinone reductase-like Zn-dependent oxidoreductase